MQWQSTRINFLSPSTLKNNVHRNAFLWLNFASTIEIFFFQMGPLFILFQVKIWFQNRRAKWKRVKAGLTATSGACGGHRSQNSSNPANKIVVPIPVHVNRFVVRSQHQELEKSLSSMSNLNNLKMFPMKRETDEREISAGF